MKKIIALLLMMTLALTLSACGEKASKETQAPTEASEEATTEVVATTEAVEESTVETQATTGAAELEMPDSVTIGALSMLNMTEEDYAAFVAVRQKTIGQISKEGLAERPENMPEGVPEEKPDGAPDGPPGDIERKVVYYDSLDALLMALNAGDITLIEIYDSVGRYLCANNDNLHRGMVLDTSKELNTFAELTMNGLSGNDFAFLMMEDHAELRDEFNTAIADMKADGTLDRLVKEQIDDLIDGAEIKAVELPTTEGAETVKVAVTGSLPPMDYVAADGTPAGFNTAVLAEIGQRIGKNIELVVVDSIGRASALASGTVDVVFWTRTSSTAQEAAEASEEVMKEKKAALEAEMSEEEVQLMKELDESIDFTAHGSADMPEGTIVTEAYYSDLLVAVFNNNNFPGLQDGN